MRPQTAYTVFVALAAAASGAFAASFSSSPSSSTLDLRLITYNVRSLTRKTEKHERHWNDRRHLFTDQLKDLSDGNPNTLMCLQEVMASQLDDIQSGLGGSWAHVGVGRDDGKRGGEFSPIFYKSDAWNLIHHQTYWLSQTPHRAGSYGWDANFPRIVTVAKLKSTETREDVVFQCTHFDWKGRRAQWEEARMLVRLIGYQPAVGADSTPVFVAGDLNMPPAHGAFQNVIVPNITDVRTLIGGEQLLNKVQTYTGFNDDARDDMMLDYLMIKDPRGMDKFKVSIPSNVAENGEYISDHRPIVADLEVTWCAEGVPGHLCPRRGDIQY